MAPPGVGFDLLDLLAFHHSVIFSLFTQHINNSATNKQLKQANSEKVNNAPNDCTVPSGTWEKVYLGTHLREFKEYQFLKSYI